MTTVFAQVLEDRLSDSKEALLEKELVLEEVAALTRKLRKQANDNRAQTLLLSKKVRRPERDCCYWARLDGFYNGDHT